MLDSPSFMIIFWLLYHGAEDSQEIRGMHQGKQGAGQILAFQKQWLHKFPCGRLSGSKNMLQPSLILLWVRTSVLPNAILFAVVTYVDSFVSLGWFGVFFPLMVHFKFFSGIFTHSLVMKILEAELFSFHKEIIVIISTSTFACTKSEILFRQKYSKLWKQMYYDCMHMPACLHKIILKGK